MEPSPSIDEGRPVSTRATQLDLDDYRTLLDAVRALPTRPLPDAVGQQGTGVTLRLDATDGLVASIGAMRDSERDAAVASFLSISPFSGDLVVCREGTVRIDPRLFPLLKAWAGGAPIGLLNELPDAFLAAGRTPWTVLKELADQLAAEGVEVAGVVTPDVDEAATELALLLEHHGIFDWGPESFFEPYGLQGRELIDVGPRPIEKLPCLDWIEEVSVAPEARRSQVFSRRLRRPVMQRPAIARRYGADFVVLSTPAGWRVLAARDGGHESLLDTAKLVEFLGQTAHCAAVLVICRPEHFAGSGQCSAPAPGTLRDLPVPFDSYFALASDVDWSTPAKALDYQHYLNEDLGLPVAGSFYLFASHARWLSAFDRRGRQMPPDPKTGWSVEAMAATGALDTFHHWTNSIFQAHLTEPDAAGVCRTPSPIPLGWGFGFVIRTADRPCLTATLELGDKGTLQLEASQHSDRKDADGLYQSFLPLPESLSGEFGNRWAVRLPDGYSRAKVTLSDLDPTKCADLLTQLAARGVHPAVYNPHGGNARDIGNLRGARLSDRRPSDAVFDMDEPASIYCLIDELDDIGVRFVSVIGETFRRDLGSYASLLKTHMLRTGKEVWSFSRFLSRRAQEWELGMWCYGKNVQHAAGIGFQISDVLQRLHWCEPAFGAIVYTHLGHTEFNQTGDRLTWKADTYSAFEQLAANYHPDGEEAPACRPWVCATSTLLLHRAVASALPEQIRYRDNCVEIAPWDDARLRLSLATSAGHDTRFLHGQCFHVDDAATACMRTADAEIRTLARTSVSNGTDCVTIVDDTSPTPLLLSLNGTARKAAGAQVNVTDPADDWRDEVVTILPEASEFEVCFDFPSVDLAHQWAWMLDVHTESLVGLEIALRDGRGEIFGASDDADTPWALLPDIPADGGGWRRLVFEFANRKGHVAGRPRGGIDGLSIRSRGSSAAQQVEIKGAALLRPASACVEPANEHYLGGRILDQSGRPLVGVKVHIASPSEQDARTVEPDPNGFFEVAGLRRHGIYAVEAIMPNGRWTCARGRYFAATRDCWDWDITALAWRYNLLRR